MVSLLKQNVWVGIGLVGLVALSACVDSAPQEVGTAPAPVELRSSALGAGTFEEVRDFGSNPGALKMYRYSPPGVQAGAGLVVAMHPCTVNARGYRESGFEKVADEHGFYVMYPEQQSANNALTCFNWAGEYGDPTNLRRGEGENESIINMVRKMESDFEIDSAKIFVAGHSGGGAMAALMMATWPDVFAGGGIFAGIPYDCTTTFTQVSNCLNPGLPQSATEWGNRVRAAFPEYSGPYPRVSIWHGTTDNIVSVTNATELVEQWTDVHGADASADATEQVGGFPRHQFHNARGEVIVEHWEMTGLGHGTFVNPSEGCGTAGAYLIDSGVCAAEKLADFFGLTGADVDPGDRTAPVVDVTAPQHGATVSGVVPISVSATDDDAVARVEVFVNGELVQTLTAAPYNTTWDASGLANGQYAIRAVAFDAAGNSSADDDTEVSLQGGVEDTTAPTVTITAPAGGSEVSGQVTIEANATDDFTLRSVAFLVDGAPVGESSAAPYSATWDAAASGVGEHTLVARATDAAGNTSEDTITVTAVDGPVVDMNGPAVEITSPTFGDQVSGIITITVDAQDADGIDQVLLFQGDELIGADRLAPFEFLYDTAFAPQGTLRLTARAFDLMGNVGVAETQIIVSEGGFTNPNNEGGPAPTLEEPVKIGKAWWGCSTASAGTEAPTTGALLLMGLLLIGVFARRRSAVVLWVLAGTAASLIGCGGDDIFIVREGGNGDEEMGTLTSASAIAAFMENKTLIMEGVSIPTHPNGFDENVNFGQATQCYHKVSISPLSGRWTVSSDLGTLTGASEVGQVGACDRASVSTQLEFVSTAVLIENVQGDGECFDVTMTFPGFGQEGRGSIDEAAGKVTMELFFKDQAIGHRCADGAVGDPTVTLNNDQFAGNALQTYTIFE